MNQQFKPINSDPSGSGININTQTVASAVRTTARIGGWLGFFGFGIQAVPFLLPIALGSLIVLRSCSISPHLAFAPPPARQAAPQTIARAQTFRPPVATSPIQQAAITNAPPQTFAQPAMPDVIEDQYFQQQPATQVTAQRPAINPMAEMALQIAGEMYQDTPLGVAIEFLPDLATAAQAQQQAPASRGLMHAPFQFNAPGLPGHRPPPIQQRGRGFGTDMMRGMLADQNGQQAYEMGGIFESISGRKFVGTCQIPGQPSKRVELIIDRIRDRGSNITARLKLLEGRRKSLNVTGVIEDDPPRLTLIPKQSPTSFGTFLTHMPWYSNSPTRITLYMDGAKALSGESAAGEQFEFLPKALPPASNPSSLEHLVDGEELLWTITHRNSQPTNGDQLWQFNQTSKRRGNFTWLADNQTKVAGRYTLPGVGLTSLTLSLKQGEKANIYRCMVQQTGNGRLRVCVPQAGAARPTQMQPESGHIFDLTHSQ